MEHMFKKALCITALLSGVAQATSPFLLTRSDALRAGRLNAGLSELINKHGEENMYGELSVTIGGGQTFRSNRITENFFDKNDLTSSCDDHDKVDTLTFSGAATTAGTAWYSQYANTDAAFRGTVTFKPKRSVFFADFDLYVGGDEWMCGSWLRVHAPFASVRTSLNAVEAVSVPGAGAQTSVLPYFLGEEVSTISAAPTQERLEYGKWSQDCGNKNKENGLADIHIDLGWNFFSCEDYHMGLGVHFVAPTGNRPNGEYLFEPVVGNGKHFELGGVFTGHVNLWNCEENDSRLGLYVDANVSHMFSARQTRSFDLVGKPNSRYALATTEPVNPSIITAAPIANLTAQQVKVKVNVQGDVAARFVYNWCAFGWEIGYNLWATSCEDICNYCPSRLAEETWTILATGDIHGIGTGATTTLTADDIEFAQSKGLSHTVFSHLNYTWEPAGECCWGYFAGVGGEVEFAQSSTEDCKAVVAECKSVCDRAQVSQWSVWAKLGLTF